MYAQIYTEKLKQEKQMMIDYGSKEHYVEMFSDIIADASYDAPAYGDNLVEAFKLALSSWRKYHAEQVLELDRLTEKLNEQS